MLSTLVWESLDLWPLAAAAGAVLTVAVLGLYPSQVRSAGWGRWLPPLLRWIAVLALVTSLLKPVILRPKTANQLGAVAVLLDTSRSMSVSDPGRTPAERVALASALGDLPAGVRADTGAAIAADIDRLAARARGVLGAQSDLEYARVSGRGIGEKQSRLQESVLAYLQEARPLAARASGFPEASELRQRLKELDASPAPESHDAWLNDVLRRRIAKARDAAREFQAAADETLYKSNPGVRKACDQLARLSRIELAERAVLQPESGLIARLGGKVPVLGLTIDQGLSSVTLTGKGRPVTSLKLAADADQSDLTGAIAAAVTGISDPPLRAVVLLSDGRQVGGRGDVTSALRPSGVPVFTVGVAPAQTPDVSITGISLPALTAFAGETLDGVAEVAHVGAIAAPSELRIRTDLGEQPERLAPSRRAARPSGATELTARFAVTISAGGAQAEKIVFSVPPVPGETTDANNLVERWVKVSSDKLNVAVCTAAPNWDFQYLRGALARQPWVHLESQVLDPEHPRLALSPAQIVNQDVLVLSDVPAAALDFNQWDAVNTLVKKRGGSVILIAGACFPVADYAQQPFARELLPFQDVRPAWKQWQGDQPAFHFVATAAGAEEALRLGEGPDTAARFWPELPGVYRYFAIPERNLIRGVQKLLVEAISGAPVLTEMRAGAGRVLFFGLDETWRWRLKSGEPASDHFWRQLVRYAAGEPYAASQGPLALDVDKVFAGPGEPVHLRARVRGARFPAENARSCQLLVLRDGKPLSTRSMTAVGAGRFSLQIRDLPAGDYQFELRGVAADGSPAQVRVPLHLAENHEAEMRDVSGDPEMLKRIARASGGEYLPIDQIDRLPERLSALRETESQFTRQPLWNSPFLYIFVLACFAAEWALRKRFGLA